MRTLTDLAYFLVFVVITPILVVLGGMLVGYIIGWFDFVANPVREGLAAVGIEQVALWKLTGALALLSIPLANLKR